MTRIALLFPALLLSAAHSAQARVIHVPQDFATIQAAVDAAAPGDKIAVGPGDFAGAHITKPLQLSGTGNNTRITSGDPLSANVGFSVQLNQQGPQDGGVTISHFTFESTLDTKGMFAGVVVRAANYGTGQKSYQVEVSHNVFHGGYYGAYLLNCDQCTVSHNDVVNTVTPIMLWGVLPGVGSAGNTISFNTIRSNVLAPNSSVWFNAGIWLKTMSGGTVTHNVIAHNQIIRTGGTAASPVYAIFLTGPAGTTLAGNQITLNDFRGSDNGVGAAPASLLGLNEISSNLGDTPGR